MLSCVCACTCVCVVDRWIGFSKEHTHTHTHPYSISLKPTWKTRRHNLEPKKEETVNIHVRHGDMNLYWNTQSHTNTHTCENRESGKLEKWKINNKKKTTDGNDACEIGKIGAMGIFSVLERVRMPSTGQRQNYNISGKKGRKSSLQLQCLFHEKWNDTIKFLI